MINRVISYSTSSYAMIKFPFRKFDLSFSTQTFLPMQSYYQPLIIHSHNNPLLQIILNMASAIIPSVNKGQELTPFFPQNETARPRYLQNSTWSNNFNKISSRKGTFKPLIRNEKSYKAGPNCKRPFNEITTVICNPSRPFVHRSEADWSL